MNKMKKLISLLLTAVMMLSMVTVNVFAEDDGTITVENATLGEDYTVYKMFSMTKDNGAYAYIVEDEWEPFFTGEYEDLIDSKGQADAEAFNNISDLSAFAGIAAQWAEDNGVPTFGQENNVDDTTVEFDGLDMGYYLVTSTFSGGLCMLTNAEPDATIVDKNFLPSIAKGVDEDDDKSSEFVLNNDAYIGQEVDFQIVVTTDAAPEDYVVTDTLEEDKWDTTDTEDSVVVKHIALEDSSETELDKDDDYTVEVTDNVIEIIFDDASLAGVKAYDKLVITYTAKLSGDADISNEDDQDPNTNKAILDYTSKTTGAVGETRESQVTNTYTWEIPVFKYEEVEGVEVALEGAKFVLQNDDDEYYAVKNGVVSWVDDIEDATELTSDEDGALVFEGVDTGDYILIETEAPDGYNMASDTELTTSVTISESGDVDYDDADLKVENSTGAILPETGGIGTLIFRVGGVALIVMAAVLLVMKKRTNNI